MNYLFAFIKKNKDLLIVFLLSIFLFIGYFVDICSGYLSYGRLDLEYFLLSDYGFLKHLIPNKDITYSYGIIQYYRFENLLTLCLYYLILPLLFTTVYFLLKKVMKGKSFLYLSIIFIFIFLSRVSGFNTFWRYGVLVVLSMVFGYLFYNKKTVSRKILFGMGLILGLIFYLINDQGTYLILIFIPLYFLNDAIQNKKSTFSSSQYYKRTLKNIVFLISGFVIGSVPLIIYLIQNKSLSAYLKYFGDLSNLIAALKTPFFNFVTTPDNLFTIIIFCATLLYLSVKYIYFKSKFNLMSFYQLSLVLSILCMEQKNIVRSISGQITFVSFILLILLLYEILINSKYVRSYKRIIVFSAVLFIVVFLCGLSQSNTTNVGVSRILSNIKMSISGSCYINNIDTFLSNKPEYVSILNKLKSRPDFNGKVFSFPSGDAILYTMLNQIPPFYNSVGSDSSLEAQNRTIQYIKDNNIRYITLYYASPDSILDGVPNYIRESTEFKYILTNFYPLDLVKDHLILVKRNNADFIKAPILGNLSQYKESLLNISLGMIPYSEGLYKYEEINKGNLLIKANNQLALEKKLRLKPIYSQNKFVVIIPSVGSRNGTLNSLKIIADGIESTINFNSCKEDKPCIINLSNIPLFYKNRNIEDIQLDKNFKGEIRIIELNNLGDLW